MTTQTNSTIEHRIGAQGAVTLSVPAGGVTIQGIDGDTVRLSSPSGRDLHEDYRIETADGLLELRPRDDPSRNFGIFSRRRFDPIHAEVPRGAVVRLHTASGAVHVDGLHGEQAYRAVSGSIKLTDVSGEITLDHVSGDAKVRGTGPVSLTARTVSGDVNASAPSFTKVQARMMSGSLRLAGRLVGEGPFAIDSVSGDASLELDGPARIEGTAVSGGVRTDLPHRSGGRPGLRTVDIGDGGPRVSFKTISGDLRVTGPQAAPTDEGDAPDGASSATVSAEPGPGIERGDEPVAEGLASRRLAVLSDLEEGRIDVTQASERLAAIDAEEDRAEAPIAPTENRPLSPDMRWDHRA
jgi:putative adhesin